MKALILAGGEGRRLKALAGGLPKCLVKVQGRPFIEHQIDLLRSEGIEEFVLCVGLGARMVMEALQDGGGLGVSIHYSSEESPLGTAGAIKNASPFIDGRFLCANGDTLVEFALNKMEKSHQTAQALATILCTKVGDATGRGTIRAGPGGEILGFEEKVSIRHAALINCGFYLMEEEILDHIPSRTPVSLEHEVFPQLVSSGLELHAFPAQGNFVDIGTPDEYLQIKEKGWRQ